MTAEELLVHFAHLIQQQLTTPNGADDEAGEAAPPVGDSAAANVGIASVPGDNIAGKGDTGLQHQQVEKQPAVPPIRVPAQQQPASSTPAPWDGLTGPGPATNMTPTAELAAKMQWLASNLPGGISMRQLVLDATEKYVNELLAIHYKP
nr:hypothetical protein [uncultured Duganella sp.]